MPIFLYLYLSEEKIEKIKNKCTAIGMDYHDFCQKFTDDHSLLSSFLIAKDAYTYVNNQADDFIGET